MAFYLKCPTGDIRLEKLSEFCIQRAKFLVAFGESDSDISALHGLTWPLRSMPTEFSAIASSAQTQCGSKENSYYHDVALDGRILKGIEPCDSLIPGTAYDVVSHWIVRMACSTSQTTWNYFTAMETKLFEYHLQCMSTEEIELMLRTTTRHIRHLLGGAGRLSGSAVCSGAINDSLEGTLKSDSAVNQMEILTSLLQLLSAYPTKTFAKHLHSGSHDFYVQLPFQEALDLVARRLVTLKDGVAQVSFAHVHILISQYFRLLLNGGFSGLQSTAEWHMQETRFRALFIACTSLVSKGLQQQSAWRGFISLDQLPVKIGHSPPCIKNTHSLLQSQHKIHHNARFKLTLYQKEMGLNVQDCIEFWRSEYLLGRQWATRYIYSIRHMYGLAGTRRNYSSHGCKEWQSSASVSDEGVCPFACWDVACLTKSLTAAGLASTDVEEIVHLRSHYPSQACMLFHSHWSAGLLPESSTRDAATVGSLYSKCQRPIDFLRVTENLVYDTKRN